MQDGAATSGLADDDRGDGDRARGLRDCVAEVHGIAAEVIQDKTAGMEQPGVGGRCGSTKVWGLEGRWQGHWGPWRQAEEARRELETTMPPQAVQGDRKGRGA